MTIRERLLTALLARGYREDGLARSAKYITLVAPITTAPETPQVRRRVYLGLAGALRGGRTIAGSIPLDKFKAQLLEVTK